MSEAAQHRVLLVEDSLTNQRLVQRSLENMGCLVEHVKDGRAALQRLLDRELPAIDFLRTDREMSVESEPDATVTVDTSDVNQSDAFEIAAGDGTELLLTLLQQHEDVLRKLRGVVFKSSTPIEAMTIIRDMINELGIDAHVTKPLIEEAGLWQQLLNPDEGSPAETDSPVVEAA